MKVLKGEYRPQGWNAEQDRRIMGHMWSTDRAPELASEYLSRLKHRWKHVRTVGELADALVADDKVSREIGAAAWLHDVGYAQRLAMTGFHPLDGATFLARQGAPSEVVGLVAHHTGAPYEAEERGLAMELAGMPVPDPSALDIVTLLDLVAAPDGKLTDPKSRIAEILRRYPASDPVHRAVTRSQNELLSSAARARRRLGLSDVWPAGAVESMVEA